MNLFFKSKAYHLEWLSDDYRSPFANKLWKSILERALINGLVRMSKEVIEEALMFAPSDCLFSKRGRRDLITALISLISVLPGGAEEIVKSILDFHEDSLNKNSGVCRLGKYHDVLHVAAYLVVRYQVKNLQLVSLLLINIFQCEKGFDRIIGPAVLGSKVSHILSSWKPDSESSEEALGIVKYLNYYSNLGKLNFTVGRKHIKKRFLDAPLSSLQETPPLTVAVLANDVKSVETLLQEGVELDLYGLSCPYKAVTQKLSNYARVSFNLQPLCHCSVIENSDYENVYEVKTIHKNLTKEEWLDLLCATSFNLDPSCIMCRCKFEHEIQWPKDNVRILNLILSCMTRKTFLSPEYNHPKLLIDKLIDFNPFSLKHLTRTVIRGRLYENWQLPLGISCLGLPSLLVKYLSLESNEQ
ncbi:UNVERIFIED_CONTAM: hypothetical protein RMT77_016602 [Armadillidium vulgare]